MIDVAAYSIEAVLPGPKGVEPLPHRPTQFLEEPLSVILHGMLRPEDSLAL